MLLSTCTAGNMVSVKKRFPSTIKVKEFIFFDTDYASCTFAEVRTSESSYVDKTVFAETEKKLEALSPEIPFQQYEFPIGSYAYFRGKSLAEVASILDNAGDESLAFRIEENIFRAKDCWERLRKKRQWNKLREFGELISDTSGIVIIGQLKPNSTIVFFEDRDRAYYFGP